MDNKYIIIIFAIGVILFLIFKQNNSIREVENNLTELVNQRSKQILIKFNKK